MADSCSFLSVRRPFPTFWSAKASRCQRNTRRTYNWPACYKLLTSASPQLTSVCVKYSGKLHGEFMYRSDISIPHAHESWGIPRMRKQSIPGRFSSSGTRLNLCMYINFSLVFSDELKAVYTLTCRLVFRRN